MFGATINTAHCCASKATLSIFITLLTATYAGQYKGKALLRFHGNRGYPNALQCYVTFTLPISFIFP